MTQREVEIVVSRYWGAVDAIARTVALTDAGRRAKARCANAACRAIVEAAPRRFALLASALADLVAAWDAEGSP